MKTILTFLMAICLVVAYLRTDFSPWRIVSRDDLNALQQQATAVSTAAAARAVAGPRTGSWMWDPNYRTALEKPTVVGRPVGH